MKAFLTIILKLLLSVEALSQTFYGKPKLDSLLEILNQNERLIGSITITKAGKTIYQKTMGADAQTKDGQLMISSTNPVFRIGSITKTYTAVLTMQLIEEGKLTLDTKLSKFYPSIKNAGKITIEHLLAHQSGLYSFDNDYQLGDTFSWIYKPQTKQKMLEQFYKYQPTFEPGAKTSYSNTGYALLGFILEDISNSTFASLVDRKIAKPLKLMHTYVANRVNPSKGEVYSFAKDNGWVQYFESDLSAAGAAGSIVATTSEVAQFYSALFTGKLISTSSLETLIKLKASLSTDQFGDKIVGHGHAGSIDAYFSSAAYFPSDSVCFVFSFNGLNYPFSDVFFDVIDVYYGKSVKLPSFSAVNISDSLLKDYEGNYLLNTGDVIAFQKQFDSLYFVWEVNGYGKFKLIPIASNTFVYDPKGIMIRFGRNKEGVIDRATMYQGKQTIRLSRK